MKKLLFALFLAGTLSTAAANKLDEAASANERGDYAAELKITRPLAESGDSWAQIFLGDSFKTGRGVAQDFAQAAKWYHLAAQGKQKESSSLGQFNLGVFHEDGKGVLQDYAEAVKWYRLAAEQGHASAQVNLGLLHAQGRGVVQDFKKAHMWLNVAAVKGDSNSVKARDFVAKRMTAQQIGEAQTMARQCMERNFRGCD